MQLYIGNKNYSSWSLRPWLLMKHAGIGFEEVRLRLELGEGSEFQRRLARVAPVARVPVLVDGDFAVWDSLAIAEYLAERFPEQGLWPAERHRRARARSVCAEMHSGFAALRTHFPMNVELEMPEVGPRVLAERPEVARDLARIVSMWTGLLAQHDGPFLFGDFCIADAYYAPVCSRLRSYGVPLPEAAAAYVARIHELPAMRQWCAEAREEHDFIADDEPYRSAPAR
ncbi:glutathione S-transferase family protein [Caldimonas tepidiphila]|uniref:glutathione S-transferase family protein n=1 Tax=Caldimonas tepidiphila TaxID=2315841 RepID=UPI000E5B3FA6|nr:glutathione S-transferase family protein [Caldimonas tepidiphila]